MSEYYDGTKLLSLMDINGRKPEIYMCTTNRSAGKTTYFSRLCVNRWKDGQGKFALVYRYNYELDDIADKFYKDIGSLFFPGTEMTSQRRARGIYQELYIDGRSCGYAVSLNAADVLKKYSHLFSDVGRMLFDEFQSETNHYCADEIKKLISLHTSIARGQGQHVRYVPLYMCGNTVSILNPYYVEMGICNRIKGDTKFLRGDGFVLEQGYYDATAQAQRDTGFNRAFSGNRYVAYSSQAVYLNDNKAFVEQPTGVGRYLCTLRYMGVDYGIREYPEHGIVYCNDRCDSTHNNRITVTTDDHQINYVMLKRNSLFLQSLRYSFEHGCFRFKDLRCKDAVLHALAY